MSVLVEFLLSIGQLVAEAWATPMRKLWLFSFLVGVAAVLIAHLLWGS
jgi:hypothetical protein